MEFIKQQTLYFITSKIGITWVTSSIRFQIIRPKFWVPQLSFPSSPTWFTKLKRRKNSDKFFHRRKIKFNNLLKLSISSLKWTKFTWKKSSTPMKLDTTLNSQSIKSLSLVDHVQVRLPHLLKSDNKCHKEDTEFSLSLKFQLWLSMLEEWSLCLSSTPNKKFISNLC